MSCIDCGSTQNLQNHHLSYDPEIIVTLCQKCHMKIHNHGVGGAQILIPGGGVSVSVRIKHNMRQMIKKMVQANKALSESDFIRAAIREKIKKEAPHLISDLMKEEITA